GGAPEAAADALLPADIAHYLRRLPDSASAAREALRFVLEAQAGYDPPDFGAARILLPRRAVRLAAPIPRPGKVVAVSADGEPFLVAPSAVAGPEDDLHAPPGLALGVAPALAAVIGHTARDVAAEEAPSVVAGYAAAVSFRASGELARDLPHSGDGFLPLGPAIVSPDEAPDPCDLRMEIRVSGRSLGTSHSKEYPLQ
ncbi:MAG: hypothetical protein GWN85_03215, partial [Gemmatimonadetes bacterium]|nr:hypothetical protein [Gemmatimonadota bacterium]NIR35034.1 hypothetical protein [Actinomycetota bacterium]NIS29081.1 hypothetical protein [Actinomycetota bacterium]NIU64487.1 hypothetical protein [Actinomycetota bacterium]NIW26282.1 hypothetical protein [Actinomycetota bacterium]